ncbi:MAG: hypothetical protein BMS9Abin21_335 [Thermodesulfovibrionia bacterium]|nr:MAG: hypothetical protein BMS9Abin21_335 [Thermodesulfovibrionia bacterium]
MSKKQNILTGVIAGAAIVLVILMVFVVGIHMGRNQQFKRYWPFWEKRSTYRSFVPNKLNGHGVFGQIESLSESSMVIEEKDGALKTVLWDDQTRFIKNHDSFSSDALEEGETVVVIGKPNEEGDAVVARIIRVMGKRLPSNVPSSQPQEKL